MAVYYPGQKVVIAHPTKVCWPLFYYTPPSERNPQRADIPLCSSKIFIIDWAKFKSRAVFGKSLIIGVKCKVSSKGLTQAIDKV